MFAAAFIQASGVHAYQIYHSKTKFFIPIVVGGLLEAIGYLCPVYMYYEHIVQAVGGEKLSPIRLSRFQKIFLFFDCFSTVLLAVGSVLRLMTTLPANWIRLGNRLVMMGLGEQILFLAIFVFTAGNSNTTSLATLLNVFSQPRDQSLPVAIFPSRSISSLYTLPLSLLQSDRFEIAAFEAFYATDESDSTRPYFSGWKFWQKKTLGHNYMELQV
ncbi:hypothetical protein DID88_001922 [Monilinia fructigena]|uniref:Uncharacterized protein n=1 Tax=Monilinia fructigena TaxID=38457 RepID=A0A395IWT8_9HELO|nr:hypothetical protein DID88_001922 [Monilinia fructigena]